jgi:hypothetical protein
MRTPGPRASGQHGRARIAQELHDAGPARERAARYSGDAASSAARQARARAGSTC